MPITVNTTDTFEQWRVKTNLIGSGVDSSGAANITLGTLNNVAIGLTTANAAIFTSLTANALTANTASITGNTSVANLIASNGVFTNIGQVTGNLTTANIIATNAFLTNALPLTQGGTGATTAPTARTNLGLGNLAVQANSLVNITGGSIDGTTVGATTAATGAFTTLSATGNVAVDTNTFFVDSVANRVGILTNAPGSELDVKGNLRLSGSSSGYVGFATRAAAGSTTYILPAADGAANTFLQTAGNGTLSWATVSAGSGGTVTSVNANVVTGMGLVFSGGPITGSGNLTLSGTLAVANGGTGATDTATARTNLGLGNLAVQANSLVNITGGLIEGTTVGATTAATGRFTTLTATANATVANLISTSGVFTNIGQVTGNLSVSNIIASSGVFTNIGQVTGNLSVSNIIASSGVFTNIGQVTGNLSVANLISTSGVFTNIGQVTGNLTTANIIATNAFLTNALPLTQGGTGATTAQAAINALAGAVTSTQYLRGNGTNVVMSAIQAGDVPTLNQNTTGTAGNVTGTVAITNGGTGATDAATARTNLGLGNLAVQANSLVNITGGIINGTSVGSTTAATGAFTTLSATSNVTIDTNTFFVDSVANRVGILTTAPGAELDVKGNIRLSGSSSGYVGLATRAAAGSTTYILPAADGAANTYLQTAGNGTLTWSTVISGASVSNDTTTNASYYPLWTTVTTGSPTTIYITTTKLYFNPSTGTLNATVFNALSDASKKTNIVSITDSSDIISKINGVEFNWIDSGNKSAGVIAQELEQILPHLVDTSEDGIKSVNYAGIIAYLIEAVKELNIKVKNLENR